VSDGIRTHDSQIHKLELYQLSYTHRNQIRSGDPPVGTADYIHARPTRAI
jgi:hypothetical protein